MTVNSLQVSDENGRKISNLNQDKYTTLYSNGIRLQDTFCFVVLQIVKPIAFQVTAGCIHCQTIFITHTAFVSKVGGKYFKILTILFLRSYYSYYLATTCSDFKEPLNSKMSNFSDYKTTYVNVPTPVHELR